MNTTEALEVELNKWIERMERIYKSKVDRDNIVDAYAHGDKCFINFWCIDNETGEYQVKLGYMPMSLFDALEKKLVAVLQTSLRIKTDDSAMAVEERCAEVRG